MSAALVTRFLTRPAVPWAPAVVGMASTGGNAGGAFFLLGPLPRVVISSDVTFGGLRRLPPATVLWTATGLTPLPLAAALGGRMGLADEGEGSIMSGAGWARGDMLQA